MLGGAVTSGRHLRFTPRVHEAHFLVENYRPTSMIDISDGLASDLSQITRASGVGAVLYEELLPISRQARSLNNALYDGEDFELLFTLPLTRARKLLARKKRIKFPIFQIGEIQKKDKGLNIVYKNATQRVLLIKGFKHF